MFVLRIHLRGSNTTMKCRYREPLNTPSHLETTRMLSYVLLFIIKSSCVCVCVSAVLKLFYLCFLYIILPAPPQSFPTPEHEVGGKEV